MTGDHIIAVIPRHKGDRSGERPTEKAVFSNPTAPLICPFLVLGIALLSREIYNEFDSILLGTRGEENINLWLKSVSSSLQSDAARGVVGVNGSRLTTHCTRKGSTSFVASLPG